MSLNDRSPILHVKCRLVQFRIGNENMYSLSVEGGDGRSISIDVKEKNRNIFGKITDGLSFDQVFEPTTLLPKYYHIGDKEVKVKPLTVENLVMKYGSES